MGTVVPDADISPSEVSDRLTTGSDGWVLLDCREPGELEIVRMQAATSLPMSELEQRAAELDDHRPRRVVVFCHLGMRSLHVAGWLRQNGFDRAQSMTGGIDAWARQIEPDLPCY